MQFLLVRSNTILLASYTQKISLLSIIQAEKQVVEFCSKHSEKRNFQTNSFLIQFAACTITPRWVKLAVFFFQWLHTANRGISYPRAFRLAMPNRRQKPANLVQIWLQQSLSKRFISRYKYTMSASMCDHM
jgi:hypothetical protein